MQHHYFKGGGDPDFYKSSCLCQVLNQSKRPQKNSNSPESLELTNLSCSKIETLWINSWNANGSKLSWADTPFICFDFHPEILVDSVSATGVKEMEQPIYAKTRDKYVYIVMMPGHAVENTFTSKLCYTGQSSNVIASISPSEFNDDMKCPVGQLYSSKR